MELNFYTLSVIYLVYSFLGWVGETVVATAKGRRFTNRGVGLRPVLLRLRHGGRSAGGGFGRPAQQLVCAVRGQFSDRDCGRVDHGEAAGTGAPPPLVGLFR